MGKFGKELIESLKQAADHARGKKVSGMRITTPELPDVKAIRRSLDMSQDEFAAAFQILWLPSERGHQALLVRAGEVLPATPSCRP